jgi:hypothetical protein
MISTSLSEKFDGVAGSILVKVDSATGLLSKAHATTAQRREAALRPSGSAESRRERQFVLDGRKIDTRRHAANSRAVGKKKGPPMRGPNVGTVARRTSSPWGRSADAAYRSKQRATRRLREIVAACANDA